MIAASRGVTATCRGAIAASRAALADHPRHLLLGCAVAGLLASSRPAAVCALALLALIAAPRLALAPGVILAVLAGATLAQARLDALDRSALGPVLGRQVSLRVTLDERPRPSAGGSRALATIAAGRGRGESIVLRGARWAPLPASAPGHELVASGRLRALSPRDGHLVRRGAHAQLLVSSVRATGHQRSGAAGALDRLRAGAERGVSAGLDPPRAALARGMVLGQDEALAEEAREAFRASGLAHLLAASGQNVMLLAALALPLLAAAGLGLRGRLVGALALIALYVPLAGAGASIQRAGIMGGAGLVAALAGRPASRWYAVLLAAALTLLLNPLAAGDPGWQLSFAAVLAILALSARVREGLTARRWPRSLAEAVAVSAPATLATAPLLAFHFERVSAVSLPANLLAVPAVAPAMWLGMVAAVTGAAWGPAGAAVNAVAQLPLAYLGWLAHAAGSLPAAELSVGLSSHAALAGAYAALVVVVVAWMRAPRARGPALALALVAVAAAFSQARAAPPDPRAVVVSFLDVGQGDATLVQHGGASILFDAGPPGGQVLARLRRAGVRRLDVLVVTHAQTDHEGEAAAVLRRHRVGLLVDGGDGATTPAHRAVLSAARQRGVRRMVPDAGQVLRAGPLEVRILWPRAESAERHLGADPNLRAVVAHVRAGHFDLLLPADAESEVTSGLSLPEAEAFKVAHHGSEDPGLPELLARVRPRLAVIEVGRGNSYGHPTRQALDALRAVPSLYRTDRDGTVRLIVLDGRMTVATGS